MPFALSEPAASPKGLANTTGLFLNKGLGLTAERRVVIALPRRSAVPPRYDLS